MSQQLREALERKQAATRKHALAGQTRIPGEPTRGPPDKRALTDVEAAEYIGMSVYYLRAARSQGDIGGRTPGPDYVKLGRQVRYLREDLDNWLEQHRVERELGR